MFVWINKEVQINLNHVQQIIRLADKTLNVYLQDHSHKVDAEYESSVLDAARWLGRLQPEDFPTQDQNGKVYARKPFTKEDSYR